MTFRFHEYYARIVSQKRFGLVFTSFGSVQITRVWLIIGPFFVNLQRFYVLADVKVLRKGLVCAINVFFFLVGNRFKCALHTKVIYCYRRDELLSR